MRNIQKLLIVALGLRLILVPFGTLALDFGTFVAWSDRLVEVGFDGFYQGWSDYLPGYLYILRGLGWVKGVVGLPEVYLYKLPAIIADLATGWVIYVVVRDLYDGTKSSRGDKKALMASGLYVFNPAIIVNSTLWGQVDSLTALGLMLAIWLVRKNLAMSAVALSLGTLVKPQVVFVVPVIMMILWEQKNRIRDLIVYATVGAGVFLGGFWPFARGGNLIEFVLERVRTSLGQYPYASVNAFNFWSSQMWERDDVGGAMSFQFVGYYLVAGIVILLTIFFWKKKRAREKAFSYYLASVLLLVTYLFLTRMHERHMLPALAPMVVAGAMNPAVLASYIGLSAVYVVNMLYAYTWITQDFRQIVPFAGVVGLGMVNIMLFVWMIVGRKKWMLGWKWGGKEKRVKFDEIKMSGKRRKIILGGILAFSLVSRVAFLNLPEQEYFDEVYHAFTARRMYHMDPKAWEWWNPHPEGFAYEWTHPPLAKIGMVAGMKVLGEGSIGWRMPAVLLGVGVVYLVYLIGKELVEDEVVGLLSAGVMAVEGLPLVMSRIGMNDMYLLFFMLAAFYFYLKDKYFWAAVGLGMAAASKWSFLWFLPILGIGFLSLRKKFSWSLGWILLLPPLIYVASYAGMFWSGHSWDIFVGVQKQMWWYHTRLVAEHPYTSPWWSWPILIRPIWLYTSGVINGKVRNIYAMGNPVVFWSGIVAVGYVGYLSFVERSRRLGLLVFSYLIFFVSWAASPRIMFLYHYLPSVPFMAMMIGVALRKHKRLVTPFFGLSLILFVYFYPHWTGLPVPIWLDRSYYWFASWQ